MLVVCVFVYVMAAIRYLFKIVEIVHPIWLMLFSLVYHGPIMTHKMSNRSWKVRLLRPPFVFVFFSCSFGCLWMLYVCICRFTCVRYISMEIARVGNNRDKQTVF